MHSSGSGSSNDAFKFPKLNGENYAIWYQHMQSSLQARYLWLIVTGDESEPTKPKAEEPTEAAALATWKAAKKEWLDWSLRDQAAQGLMKGAAEPSQWPHVASSKTSKEMWDNWRKLYVTNQQKLNVHYYFEELYTTKYVDGTSMADHLLPLVSYMDSHKLPKCHFISTPETAQAVGELPSGNSEHQLLTFSKCCWSTAQCLFPAYV